MERDGGNRQYTDGQANPVEGTAIRDGRANRPVDSANNDINSHSHSNITTATSSGSSSSSSGSDSSGSSSSSNGISSISNRNAYGGDNNRGKKRPSQEHVIAYGSDVMTKRPRTQIQSDPSTEASLASSAPMVSLSSVSSSSTAPSTEQSLPTQEENDYRAALQLQEYYDKQQEKRQQQQQRQMQKKQLKTQRMEDRRRLQEELRRDGSASNILGSTEFGMHLVNTIDLEALAKFRELANNITLAQALVGLSEINPEQPVDVRVSLAWERYQSGIMFSNAQMEPPNERHDNGSNPAPTVSSNDTKGEVQEVTINVRLKDGGSAEYNLKTSMRVGKVVSAAKRYFGIEENETVRMDNGEGNMDHNLPLSRYDVQNGDTLDIRVVHKKPH